MKKSILFPLMAAVPMLMFGGGFQVNLQGNKQAGMGHLGTSFYQGASSTYFNPGLMTFGDSTKKINIEAGGSGIISYVSFQQESTGYTAETDNPLGTPFYLYSTYQVNEELSAGLAVYTPFGSSVDWGEDWRGRYLIQDISLAAVFIQPTVSYKLTDKLGIGAGLVYATGNVEINRAIPASATSTTKLEGDANGIGFNAGLYFQATEKLSVGLTYRSAIDMEAEDQDASFIGVPASLSANFPASNTFSTTLPLPATTTIGLTYRVNDKLTVAGEVSLVGWEDYESLDFDFGTNTSSLADSENPRNYENSNIYRIGAQYQATEKLIARLGFYYDESPVQDAYFNPETPNSDNTGITAGFSFMASDMLSIDGSFIYISGAERDSEYEPANFGGTYKSQSFIPGIGVNLKF